MSIQTKDLTSTYLQFRSQYFGQNDSDEESSFLLKQDVEMGEIRRLPVWQREMENVQMDMKDLKNKLRELKGWMDEHTTHRTAKSVEKHEKEKKRIQVVSTSVKELVRDLKGRIERLQGGLGGLSDVDRTIATNVQQKLMLELRELSSSFQSLQGKYLNDLKVLKSRKTELNSLPIDLATEEEQDKIQDMMDQMSLSGMTDEQVQAIIQNHKSIIRRDRELGNIFSSIMELQELFQEFSTQVIEQGTLLDRIDSNIVSTQIQVQKGNKSLEKTDRADAVGRSTVCILFLILIVVLFLVIVFFKVALSLGL